MEENFGVNEVLIQQQQKYKYVCAKNAFKYVRTFCGPESGKYI